MANLSHGNGHGDFDPDEASLLRALARGGMPGAQMYYEGSQGNGLGQGQEIEDSAALLEALANFDSPLPNAQDASANNHFASLLQAAATAGGAEAARNGDARTRRILRTAQASAKTPSAPASPDGTRKRKRDGAEDESPASPWRSARDKSPSQSDEEQLAREREIWGPEEPGDEPTDPNYEGLSLSSTYARAAGVHSAAALFRRPTEASKKYTRPPMAKVFTSLGVSPEMFLRLQAGAKSYMLDPDHPERRDCVGSRGRGDTDLVKLKLFRCVEAFLEDEGWGDRCFGAKAPGATQRKHIWPQAKHKIISLVTPLLRRMVTNERQRQYALQTRKSQAAKRGKADAPTPSERELESATSSSSTSLPFADPDIDPKLSQYTYNVAAGPAAAAEAAHAATNTPEVPETASSEPRCLVHVMRGGKRALPKPTRTQPAWSDFAALTHEMKETLASNGLTLLRVQALSPASGLVAIEENEAWQQLLQTVTKTEWLDGVVTVVVEVGDEVSKDAQALT